MPDAFGNLHQAGPAAILADRAQVDADPGLGTTIAALSRLRYNAIRNAGIAQLVERNLAKVEVESSRLFARSKFKKGKVTTFPFFIRGAQCPSAEAR